MGEHTTTFTETVDTKGASTVFKSIHGVKQEY